MTLEPNRPLFHFTPPINWMNDPNGLVYHDGEYHLYYQHNPYGKAWGHMSWGHAVSSDLVHWKHLPIAIFEEPKKGYTIFSGSAVADARNTGGFARDATTPLVAVYTADYHPDRDLEDVHIAYSLDRGRTFTQYKGNPVIGVHNGKFGDPKAFWHEPSGQWILVAIHGAEQGCVDLFGSRDLKNWELLSTFHAPQAAPGIWECPDLFPLDIPGVSKDSGDVQRWVLKVNPIFPNGGPAVTRYFVGEFDGRQFRGDPLSPQMVYPDGDPIYAEVTYNDEPRGRRILVGWIRQAPRDERSWTGMQSIPRELSLREIGGHWRLCQWPIAEMQTLRRARHSVTHANLSGASPVLDSHEIGLGAWEIDAQFDPAHAAECGVQVRLGHNAIARAGYSAETNELFVDTPGRARLAITMHGDGNPVRLRVFVDRGLIEVFGGEGQATITALLEPETAGVGLGVFAQDGTAGVANLDVWELASSWSEA